MAGLHGLDFSKGLLLILHTPGGRAVTVQTLVDYLRIRFTDIDVLVPTYAMSAGTMIALGCDRIIIGRQSQLGPRTHSSSSGIDHIRPIRLLSSSRKQRGESLPSLSWPTLGHLCSGHLGPHWCWKLGNQSPMGKLLCKSGWKSTCFPIRRIQKILPRLWLNILEATSMAVTEGALIGTKQDSNSLKLLNWKIIEDFRRRY